MKTFRYTDKFIASDELSTYILAGNHLLFDIETTGFSAKTNQIYLIGCVYLEDDCLQTVLFFAEQPEEEPEILAEFDALCSRFDNLVSFNGISFDAPFLSARYARYGMETVLPNLGHYDIYKSIAPYKKILKLDNLKQKTLEKYLGIDRTDQYNGGELIGVYHSYVKHPNDETRSLLLQHNHDDVQGMIRLLPLFSYAELFNGNFRFESYEIYNYTTMNGTPAKELHIRFSMQCRLPKDFSAGYGSYYLKTSGDHFTLRIRIYEEELKYFYPNYKDYYYLPYEDEAIHKSVAFCVDKDYRIQAKAATCYSRKNGCFLPQQDEWVLPYFKSEYKDKHTYFELTNDFLNSPEHLTTYARHILDFLTKK